MGPRALPAFLLAGGAVLATLLAVPPGLLRGGFYQILLWGSVTAVLVGLRRHRPVQPRSWQLIAAGLAVLAVSSLVDPRFYAATPTLTAAGSPLGDVLAAIGYPLIGWGTLCMSRAQSSGRDRGPVLDSVLVTLALTTLLWEGAFARQAGAGGDPTFLPSVMVMSASASWVAAMTIRVMLSGGYRARSGRALLAASLLGCLGTATWTWQWLPGGLPSDLAMAMWSVGLLLLGAAALDPSMRRLTEPADVEAAHTISRVVLPALALLVPAAAMVTRQLIGGGTRTVAAYASLLIGIVVVLRFADLVSDRESAREALRHQSLHDPLTDLPNRVLLVRRLAEALRLQDEGDGQVGVCFMDLDRFKAINDTHGHAAGDQTLTAVASRLRAECGPGITVARFAGDEFVVVKPHSDAAALMALAIRLREAACVPVVLRDGTVVSVGATVGVALADRGLVDPDRLLIAADNAMYVAKRQGRGGIVAGAHLVAAI